jgi:hypothetical protein
MRTYPISELLNLTRAELLALYGDISDALAVEAKNVIQLFEGRSAAEG